MRLDLSKNALTELPKEFGNLTQLKRLDLYSNKLSDLPLSCVNLVSLRWLDLKNNPLQTLWPDVIGNCLREEECKECARNVSGEGIINDGRELSGGEASSYMYNFGHL